MPEEFFHRDMRVFMDQRFDWARYLRLRHGDVANVADDVATFRDVLRTTGDICESIAGESRGRWRDEVELVDGEVVVPPHIAAGYAKLREAGLVCLTMDPQYGGYGLPLLVNTMYLEMVARADARLMTIVGLQAGVAQDIEKYGSEELKRRYLPGFASGELQGAMDLTEPEAGSDLGGITTRVTRDGDRYLIDGEKIYITNGGAPIHLVLARDAATYEQSKGTTNGLDLLLCPKVLPDGRRNGMRVARVERKLGIHGSPTCVVEFERAEGFLLGTPGQGFRAMLDLMNNARLGVAAQAVGIAEAAYEEAREYALQRRQFGVSIIAQPLMKSMLTLMRINIEAARALVCRTAALIDMTEALRRYLGSERGQSDPEHATLGRELEANTALIRFFTPLCKYYATEISNHVTRQGIQVHGGIGYMVETHAGQFHADSIITTIYEGTSEIQASFALKEMAKGALFSTLEQIEGELEGLRTRHPELVELVSDGVKQIRAAVPSLMGDQQYALLNAKRVCEMVIDVVVSAELLCQADMAEGRLELAQSFIHRHIPAVRMNADRINTGDASRIARYDKILGLSEAETS
jgi:alkylation response protein AidB-like acyl-CoA dehydrogenase